MIDQNFWKSKRVFLTGHTGFKGSWLALWLSSLGVTVRGYSLNPPTTPSLFEEMDVASLVDSQIGDIRNLEKLKKSMLDFNPDIAIHMAAQPLVRYSYESPVETYEVNTIGTVNVLEAARSCPTLKAVLNVTTDKCYENDEWNKSFKEEDPMGGHDPYSSSKGCAELITSAYRRSFLNVQGIGLASVRAGNVIGGGDWAKDRLIPDILRSFEQNRPILIRNPEATRPWQHVLEPLSGYMVLAQKLYKDPQGFAEAWNFGPEDDDVRPVSWITNKMIEKWGDANWESDNGNQPHEARYLKLDISKAKEKLNWIPSWKLERALELIIDWHKHYLNGSNIRNISLDQISLHQKELLV